MQCYVSEIILEMGECLLKLWNLELWWFTSYGPFPA